MESWCSGLDLYIQKWTAEEEVPKERKTKSNSCLIRISEGKAKGRRGCPGGRMAGCPVEVIKGPNAEKT